MSSLQGVLIRMPQHVVVVVVVAAVTECLVGLSPDRLGLRMAKDT